MRANSQYDCMQAYDLLMKAFVEHNKVLFSFSSLLEFLVMELQLVANCHSRKLSC